MIRSARATLAILTLLNLFNYLDRYVVSALVESLKQSELAITDTQAGLLMTGFIIVYMLASPVFGVLGDRVKRPPLIALGVFLWSIATYLAGSARSFPTLFLSRAAVGIGEAAYGTIAPAMIADLFSEKNRGKIFAIFFMAIPVGSALGYVLGGWANAQWGWRTAFQVAGLPGIFLALLALLLKDPLRSEARPRTRSTGAIAGYREIFRNRTFRLTAWGYAAYTFGLGGLAFWMPAFLERVRGLSKDAASMQFGAVVVLTGFAGTFVGGWWGDRIQRVRQDGYLRFSAWTMIAAVPLSVVALAAPEPALYWPAMILTQLALFASTGPINSVIVQLSSPWLRATAVASCNFLIHVAGDVPSPPLIGWISDRSSLGAAIFLVPVAFAASAWIWSRAAASAR